MENFNFDNSGYDDFDYLPEVNHNTKYFFILEIYKDVSGTINKEARNNKLVCKPMRER